MLKKLLIAVVAVIAGTMVLTKVTKISPMVWLGDCCSSARKMVPPEVQFKQLNKEIASIDKEIRKNIGRLAAMEVETKKFEKQLQQQLARQSELKTDISVMRKTLENRSKQVVFNGDKMTASELTRKLDRVTNEYVALRETNKVHEQILEQKKQILEAAHDQVKKMQQEQQRLTTVSWRLAAHLEKLKAQQTSPAIEFDGSAIARSQELVNDIENRLNTAEREAKLLEKYGYKHTTAVLEEAKSREDVLKAAEKALEDNTSSVAVDKEEK
jgi:translation initiation factor 2 beta subunit (eIF-2beta)/eIF-5